MKFNYFTTKIPFLGLFSLIFLLASCGSYEYVGYDNDGIYGTDNNRVVEIPAKQEQIVESNNNDGTYYKNYFSEKANEIDYALNNNEIFTDIDSYEGDYNNEQDSLQYKGYAGWGQNSSNVTINVIDRGWGSWADPWLWNAGWGFNHWAYRPWGWNNWGWNNWGWNNWGWNAGFYWGWNNYGYGYPYYGYGYGYPYYNSYYGNYNRRGIAYNAGRRGSYLNRDISSINRSSRSNSRLNYNSTRTRTRNQVSDYNRSTRTRSTTRSSTQRNNSPRARANRRNSPSVSTPRSSTPRVSTPRSSGSNRSSGSVSRSSSSSRSSGSRSSGSSRSSSRRN